MIYYPISNGRSVDEFVRLLEALQASDTHGVPPPGELVSRQAGDRAVAEDRC